MLEPPGAASVAALMTCRGQFSGRLAGAILSGGNITVQQMRQWLG